MNIFHFLRLCLITENFERKCKKKKKKLGKEKYKKIKNKFKFNKLFLYVSSNSFHLFLSIITILNNFKIHKILIIFNFLLYFS